MQACLYRNADTKPTWQTVVAGCLLALIVAANSNVSAASAILEPIRDNSIYSENQSSNGSFPHLFAGRTNQGNRRRALLAFDVARANIPTGASINTVSLSCTVSLVPRSPAPSPVTARIHRVTRSWGEGTSSSTGAGGLGDIPDPGDATWNFALFSTTSPQSWTTSGSDFIFQASATASAGGLNSKTTWSSAQMKADVEAWLNGSVGDFGWIMIIDESTNKTARRFYSGEETNAANRPKLTIEYTVPSPCAITSIQPVTSPTPTCNPATNTYSKDIVVSYSNPPAASSIDVLVNGTLAQTVSATGSPQTIALTNLVANGQPVDVTARFSTDLACARTENDLFIAEANCSCEITSVTFGAQSLCDPPTNRYSQTVNVEYDNPPTSGTLDFVIGTTTRSFSVGSASALLTELEANGQPVQLTVRFSADTACSITGTFTAPANCLNLPPTIDLDSGAAGSDVAIVFAVGGGAIALAPLVDLSDGNDTHLASATIVLTNGTNNQREFLAVNAAAVTGLGITVTRAPDRQTITLSGSAPITAYETALRALYYQNLDLEPTPQDRLVTIQISDGIASSASATAHVSMDAGTIADLMGRIVARAPGSDSEGFAVPMAADLTAWRAAVSAMLTSACDGVTLSGSLANAYAVDEFRDETTGARYCALLETADDNFDGSVDRGWGTFLVQANATRDLGIHVPNPTATNGLGAYAAVVFGESSARYLLLAGSHPEANAAASLCQPAFAVSDVAHETNTPYHQASVVAAERLGGEPTFAVLEFNRKPGEECADVDVFLTYGNNDPPVVGDRISALRSSLSAGGAITVAVPGDGNGCTATGASTVQGRLLNGVAANAVCSQNATTASGRYIHVELDPGQALAADWVAAIQAAWPLELGFSLSVHPGWNLISLPINIGQFLDVALGDMVSGSVWEYTAGGYRSTRSGVAGRGYWFYSRATSQQSVPLTGFPPTASITLGPAWNLVGPIGAPPPGPGGQNEVDIDSVLTPGSYTEPIWRWDGVRLRVATTFRFGAGHWVHRP